MEYYLITTNEENWIRPIIRDTATNIKPTEYYIREGKPILHSIKLTKEQYNKCKALEKKNMITQTKDIINKDNIKTNIAIAIGIGYGLMTLILMYT